jgi:hypothetical protein
VSQKSTKSIPAPRKRRGRKRGGSPGQGKSRQGKDRQGIVQGPFHQDVVEGDELEAHQQGQKAVKAISLPSKRFFSCSSRVTYIPPGGGFPSSLYGTSGKVSRFFHAGILHPVSKKGTARSNF